MYLVPLMIQFAAATALRPIPKPITVINQGESSSTTSPAHHHHQQQQQPVVEVDINPNMRPVPPIPTDEYQDSYEPADVYQEIGLQDK